MFDLSAMSQAEIQELIQAAQNQQSILNEQRHNSLLELVQAVKDQAGELGVSVPILFGFDIAKSKKTYISRSRYAHPESPNLTWSGRGKKPGWLVKLLESGDRSLVDFEIKQSQDGEAV